MCDASQKTENSAETRQKMTLVIAMFFVFFFVSCSILASPPFWELIKMASSCDCPSVPAEYNRKNQGCMAEQSTEAEEMKDA